MKVVRITEAELDFVANLIDVAIKQLGAPAVLQTAEIIKRFQAAEDEKPDLKEVGNKE